MQKKLSLGLVFVSSIFILVVLSSITSAKNINCKENFDCLLQNSVNCTTSNVQFKTSADIFGMNITTKSLLKIRPYKNKCELYINNKDITVKITDELKNNLQSEGYTDKEITRAERRATAEARKSKGTAICRFDTAELTAILTKWNSGTFSTDDLNSAECKGKLFSTSSVMH